MKTSPLEGMDVDVSEQTVVKYAVMEYMLPLLRIHTGMKTPAPNCYTVRRPTTAIPHDLTYRAFPTPGTLLTRAHNY